MGDLLKFFEHVFVWWFLVGLFFSSFEIVSTRWVTRGIFFRENVSRNETKQKYIKNIWNKKETIYRSFHVEYVFFYFYYYYLFFFFRDFVFLFISVYSCGMSKRSRVTSLWITVSMYYRTFRSIPNIHTWLNVPPYTIFLSPIRDIWLSKSYVALPSIFHLYDRFLDIYFRTRRRFNEFSLI